MSSANKLNGMKRTLDEDGRSTVVETKVVTTAEEIHASINILLEDMVQRRNMLVGMAVEWDFCGGMFHPHPIALLKFYTELGCLLVVLNSVPSPSSLQKFLASKDLVFAGVHIKEDLDKLRGHYGLVIDNAVELSQFASSATGRNSLVAYGGRDLANKVLGRNFRPKPVNVFWSNICEDPLSKEQIRSAATDAYSAYMVAQNVLKNYN
ncbi:Protein RISC-INTERACTING CLEARING 3'-5' EXORIBONUCLEASE 2 [Linum grandiflorum]